MGQKIHPRGFRLGPLYTWTSRWFASNKQYKDFLLSDITLRKVILARLKSAGVALVELERSINKIKVTIHVSRPGVVIGRGGSGLEELKKFIEQFLIQGAKHKNVQMKEQGKVKVEVAVEPVKEPNLSAYLVGNNLADQLIRRMPHKRVCVQTVERVMSSGAQGVRIVLAGRIAGAEIARREKYQAGSVPLSTIREQVDYASVPALTKSGYIGIKVWICRKSI